jgi:hypothetical protein
VKVDAIGAHDARIPARNAGHIRHALNRSGRKRAAQKNLTPVVSENFGGNAIDACSYQQGGMRGAAPWSVQAGREPL